MTNSVIEKVLRCTPKGSIINIEAQTVHKLVNDCLESVDTDNLPATTKCARLLSMAKVCLRNKYHHTALDLFNRVIEVGQRQIDVSNSYTCLPFCYEAAKHVDAIWKKIAPHEKRVSEYARVKHYGMSSYDDYRYCNYGIDNEIRFERIQNYARRHHLAN